METWPADHELINIYTMLGIKFTELYAHPFFDQFDDSSSPPAIPGLEASLSVDPQLTIDEYHRMAEVAALLGNDAEATGLLDLMVNPKLAGWRGAAADAFRLRMTHIKSAGISQQEEIAKLMLGMGAMASLAAEFRRNCDELAQATIAAIDTELGNEATRTTKANISLMTDLTKDILAIDPKKLLAGSIGLIIGVVKNLVDRQVDGGSKEKVYASYVVRWEELFGEFQSSLAAVRLGMDGYHVTAATTTLSVDEPLPSVADIDSPNFSYSHFWSEDRSSDQFGPQVDAKRAEIAAADEVEDSEITKRLGGAE